MARALVSDMFKTGVCRRQCSPTPCQCGHGNYTHRIVRQPTGFTWPCSVEVCACESYRCDGCLYLPQKPTKQRGGRRVRKLTLIETCVKCDEPTGRAGRGEDSLYCDHDGPFCPACWATHTNDTGECE